MEADPLPTQRLVRHCRAGKSPRCGGALNCRGRAAYLAGPGDAGSGVLTNPMRFKPAREASAMIWARTS